MDIDINGYRIVNVNIFLKARIKLLYLNRSKRGVMYVNYENASIMVHIVKLDK